MKKASDKFIKDHVKGYEEIDKDAGRPKPKKAPIARKLSLNTDDTFVKYPNAFAKEAASPAVRDENQDAQVVKGSSLKEIAQDVVSRGLDQSKYKGKK